MKLHRADTFCTTHQMSQYAAAVRCKLRSKDIHSSITDSIRNDARSASISEPTQTSRCLSSCVYKWMHFNLLGWRNIIGAALLATNAISTHSIIITIFLI